jgi:branched-chain amino acid transport system substrate-binding protein
MPRPEDPIRIGYSLSLTGPLASNSRSARLAHDIWVEDVNAQGGLLGRPVELVNRDDEGDPAKAAAIYAALLDDQTIDLVVGGYGTNTNLAALPEVISRGRYMVGLMALGANNDLAYPNYFAMIPTGSDPNSSLTEGFFEVAALQSPRPTTVALLSADAVFAENPIRGAKANAAKHGFRVVHEATYSLSTRDFTPLLDEVAESACDLLFLCSYLQDSVDLLRALDGHPFRPKMVGAGMIGPQNAEVRTTLGPLLNGVVNYEYWAPAPALAFDGVERMLTSYASRAVEAGVDALGHYMAPLAYAQMQVVAQAIEGVGRFDDGALAEFTRDRTFATVMGEVRFGALGEWTQPRVLQVQFQGIEDHGLDQFRDGSRQVIVSPAEMASGQLIYPFEIARRLK